MKKHWFAWLMWILFLLAVLAIGVYVLVESPSLMPKRVQDVFMYAEGTLL